MQKQLSHISVAVIGSCDSGKTELCLSLMKHCTIHRFPSDPVVTANRHAYEDFLRRRNKGEARITINSMPHYLRTQNHHVTLIDTPGHRQFLKSTAVGMSEADFALLVIGACVGEFQLEIKSGIPQSILMAFVFGVKQMIVCVNKMDDMVVNHQQLRYEEIKKEVGTVLKKVGYDPDKTHFVPVSGLKDENIFQLSGRMPWWKGPALLKLIDSLEEPVRNVDAPLRIPISQAFKIGGIGSILVGRIATGKLKGCSDVHFSNFHQQHGTRSIEMHQHSMQNAKAGDYIAFNVRMLGTTERQSIPRRMVCGLWKDNTLRSVESFMAKVHVLRHPGVIRRGYAPVVYCHVCHVSCRFQQIRARVDKKTNEVLQEYPKSIKPGDCALVQMVPLRPMCVEPYGECPKLGRFMIVDNNEIVAVGIVKSVTHATEIADK